MSRTSHEMPALTALRAIAALLVFVYHFPPWGHGRVLDVVISQGHVGVTVFFVLSGFLITLRYYRRVERGDHPLADYFVRRAARILPLYYVVLTLTHVLSRGTVPLDAGHLPEWTLTQALFDASPDDITVTTSWSLTVEECFYATAPLLFLGIAALRRRVGAVPGTLAGLGLAVAVLFAAGSLVLTLTRLAGATHLGFLSDEILLRSYTLFGRFPDFALGALAALLYLSGRVEQTWQRRGGAVLATAVAVGGAALLVAAQAGMVRDAADPSAPWRWNLLVAAASALLVLGLTCSRAPLSRLLAFPLFVYLGRISYALYLIQLTPLGKGLLLRVLPDPDGLHLITLYVGMNVVSALLYELVEEPARVTILALWNGRSRLALPLARSAPARALSLMLVTAVLGALHAAWVLGTGPPVGEAEALAAGGASHVVRAQVVAPALDDREPRLPLPPSWKLGPSHDRRAPTSLLVFVDGAPVRFLGARTPVDAETVAYYRRPKADFVSLQIERTADVVVVDAVPSVVGAIAAGRLRSRPWVTLAPLPLLAAAALGWGQHRRVFAPRVALVLAIAVGVVWLVFGGHVSAWGPAGLAVGLTLLLWLAPEGEPAE